jgi:hyaluronan synthase
MVALPIKAYALLTMNKQGWLTRRVDSVGGEGQSAATLAQPGPRHAVNEPVPTATSALSLDTSAARTEAAA